MQDHTPTTETYQELQTAFDYFNAALFGDVMPNCLITLQRHKRTLGYYSEQRFIAHDGITRVDEIALNPAYFAVLTIEDTLSTLVHEMVHLWQFHHGNPSRKGYHNREWSEKMEAIGLMPSHTGRAGGKKVGQHMDHYIIQGGPFSVACEKLLTRDFRLSWLDRFPAVDPALSPAAEAIADADDLPRDDPEMVAWKFCLDALDASVASTLEFPQTRNRSNRSKYRCPTCKAQVWGKPGLAILCGVEMCDAVPMEDVSDLE